MIFLAGFCVDFVVVVVVQIMCGNNYSYHQVSLPDGAWYKRDIMSIITLVGRDSIRIAMKTKMVALLNVLGIEYLMVQPV